MIRAWYISEEKRWQLVEFLDLSFNLLICRYNTSSHSRNTQNTGKRSMSLRSNRKKKMYIFLVLMLVPAFSPQTVHTCISLSLYFCLRLCLCDSYKMMLAFSITRNRKTVSASKIDCKFEFCPISSDGSNDPWLQSFDVLSIKHNNFLHYFWLCVSWKIRHYSTQIQRKNWFNFKKIQL